MRAADEAAISSGTSAIVLMDRAGRAVAHAVLGLAGGVYGRRAAVVCGKGNNGGDGFVVARVLRGRGMAVTCWAVGSAGESEGAAAHHLRLMERGGVPLRPFTENSLNGADVIVDAVFGTGFRGRAEGDAAIAINAINGAPAPVVAVDIPSAVNGETGAVDGPAVQAEVTVALAAEKTGTATGPGALHASKLKAVDIGIPVEGARALMTERSDVARVLPRRSPDAHKRSGGAVALLAGSDAMTGAALLTVKGALKMGAGYATCGSTSAVKHALSSSVPEVLSTIVSDDDVLVEASIERFSGVLERAGALAIGPGIGDGESQRALVVKALDSVELPLVIDADGLNVLASDTGPLTARRWPAVLTPHPAELARLLHTSAAAIQADRLRSARMAAGRFGCVILLKGARTVVARPDGRAVVNPTGGPELATAGTGDVLCGAIATLAAAGLEAFEAAWAACYIHGLAGAITASALGAAGVLASDVAGALPAAARHLRDEGAPFNL